MSGVVGHPEPQHRLAALGLVRGKLLVGEVAAVAVVPRRAALGAGHVVALVQLLGRAVAVVGTAGQQYVLVEL